MPIVRLDKGRAVKDSALLARAQGALIGHVAGSALGFLFSGARLEADRDGLSAASIEAAALTRRLAAGQPGSSGEIAIGAARALINPLAGRDGLMPVYAAWAGSSPLTPDRAMEAAAKGQALADSLSAIALSRVTMLTLGSHTADPSDLAARVRADTALTHPSPIAGDTASVMAILVQSLLHGGDPGSAMETAHAFARRSGLSRVVIEAIAGSGETPNAARRNGVAPSVLSALGAAFFSLAKAPSFEDALEAALAVSPASDALPAIVGAVMGARVGRGGIPERLRNLVLSCRPMEGRSAQPRPAIYWATDAMAMAEALLAR